MRVLDLFSGIGGFSLGLERAGMTTVAFCEIDPFCRKVLAKHWPDVPVYYDIRDVTGHRLDMDRVSVDVIAGGFPCQPFSTASHGVRVAEDMWPEMGRVISEVMPKIVIAENVSDAAISTAKLFMENLGYEAFKRRIGGNELGSIDQRNRWWLCAYADNESKLHGAVDAKMAELPEICGSVWEWQNYARRLRVSHGVSDRVHRLRSLGNAVKPQVPELYGRAIMEAS